MNSEFGIRNSEFPPTLPLTGWDDRNWMRAAEVFSVAWGGRAEFKIQNSKFKIRKNVGWILQ